MIENIKKKFIIFSLICILILLVVYILPLQRKINVNLDGFQCEIGDNKYIKGLSINVIGTYNDYLFKDDNFLGTIKIDGYGEIWSVSNGKLIFSDNVARLITLDKDNRTNNFGDLLCEKNFSEILIIVSEKIGENGSEWTSENGTYIVAPAKNKYETIRLAEKLSEKNDWFSSIQWK